MPDGVPAQIRINPATGLPAVGQYVTRVTATPGVLTGTSFVIGTFSLIYDGVFGVDDQGGTGYAPSPPAGIGANTGGVFSITDLGGLPTITPYNEQGLAIAPVATLQIAGMGLFDVSQVNIRAAFAPFIDRTGLFFGTAQFPVFGLVNTSSYQLAFTQGAATRQDTSDFTFISLRELR